MAQFSLNAIRGHVAENSCAGDPDFACEVAFWSCLENSLVEVVMVAERLIHAPKFRGTEALQGVLAQRRINSSKNTKERRDKIPSHAEKVSDESWRCKKGYHTKYEGGESFCKGDPLDIYNKLSLEFAGNLGTQVIGKTGYDYMTDVEDPFFIEGEIGVE